MKKTIGLCLLALLCATAAVAEEYVYYIEHGTRYHHADSFFIKGKETVRVLKSEAEAMGLQPAKDYQELKEKSSHQ